MKQRLPAVAGQFYPDNEEVLRAEIRSYLESLYQEQEIFYGLFESDTSLMTCYVHSLDDGHHIHFIDGGDGGYAMAAKQLKAQMKARWN